MAPMSPSVLVQLISSTIACTGFALWFNIRGKQVVYSSIGAFICWGVYVIVYHYNPSNFYATMVASIVIAGYAQIMARVNKAPATVFLYGSYLSGYSGSSAVLDDVRPCVRRQPYGKDAGYRSYCNLPGNCPWLHDHRDLQ